MLRTHEDNNEDDVCGGFEDAADHDKNVNSWLSKVYKE